MNIKPLRTFIKKFISIDYNLTLLENKYKLNYMKIIYNKEDMTTRLKRLSKKTKMIKKDTSMNNSLNNFRHNLTNYKNRFKLKISPLTRLHNHRFLVQLLPSSLEKKSKNNLKRNLVVSRKHLFLKTQKKIKWKTKRYPKLKTKWW